MSKVPKAVDVPPLTDEMYERGRTTKSNTALDVIAARYDRRNDKIELTLRRGVTVSIPRRQIREIAKAQPADVARIEVQPGGDGISFRSINVDISVPGLLAQELGPIFARGLGRKARGRTSVQKAQASAENGRKGGRPRKIDTLVA